MSKRPSRGAMVSGIDMTPMIDLTFTILITFMVTMPAMESRIKLPTMSADDAPSPTEEIIVWYNAGGEIRVNSQTYSKEELKALLQAMTQSKKTFTLKADEARPYGEVIDVLRTIRSAGISNVSLGTAREGG